jgi:hypothetical protein
VHAIVTYVIESVKHACLLSFIPTLYLCDGRWQRTYLYACLCMTLQPNYELILYVSILLHCIVQWVLQVRFPSACSFIVLSFTVSLHVSAYKAIFRCVGDLFSYAWRILLHCFLLLFWWTKIVQTILKKWQKLWSRLEKCCSLHKKTSNQEYFHTQKYKTSINNDKGIQKVKKIYYNIFTPGPKADHLPVSCPGYQHHNGGTLPRQYLSFRTQF